MVARDVVHGMQIRTIEGYIPIIMRALACAWQKQHASILAGEQQQQPMQPQQQQQAAQHGRMEQEQPAAMSGSAPIVQHPAKSLLVTVNGFKEFIQSLEQQPTSMRTGSASSQGGHGRGSHHSSQRGVQQTRLLADTVPAVQGLRQKLHGAVQECNTLQGTLSLGYWNKFLFANTWLQEKQYEVIEGRLDEGEMYGTAKCSLLVLQKP